LKKGGFKTAGKRGKKNVFMETKNMQCKQLQEWGKENPKRSDLWSGAALVHEEGDELNPSPTPQPL